MVKEVLKGNKHLRGPTPQFIPFLGTCGGSVLLLGWVGRKGNYMGHPPILGFPLLKRTSLGVARNWRRGPQMVSETKQKSAESLRSQVRGAEVKTERSLVALPRFERDTPRKPGPMPS